MHTYLLSTSSRLHIYFGLEDQRCDDIHLWPNMYDHDNIFDLSSFPKNSKYITVLASTTVALIFTILFTPFTIIYPHLLFTPIYYLPPFTIYPHLLLTPIYYLHPIKIYPHLLFTPIYYLPPFTIYRHLLFTIIYYFNLPPLLFFGH